MNIKQFGISIAAVTSLCVVSASALTGKTAAQEKPIQAKSTLPEIHFVKPGAAVSLSHDYDGKTAAGGLVTLTVTLNHIYQDGRLTASVTPSSNLQIISGAQPVHSHLSQGSELKLYVQIAVPETGDQSLGIETVYEDPNGEQTRRVFSIPMTAQTRLTGKYQGKIAQTPKVKSTTIIGLPAQENIQ